MQAILGQEPPIHFRSIQAVRPPASACSPASHRIAKSGGEEVADFRCDLGGVRLQRKMAGVEEADDRVGNVALERLGAGWQEERVVLAPSGEEPRLVPAEVILESRVERDVA